MNWAHSIPFFLVHVLCFAVVFTGITTTALLLFVAMFFGRAFFVTAGYHRYFSHKSFKLNRFWQFVFAFMAEATAQKGVLWWAANHRHHHRYSDTDRDLHSPRKGFWWSHVGWILADKYKPTNDGRASRTSPSTPSCGSSTSTTGSRRGRFGVARVPDRWLARSRRRVLLVDGAALAHARSS